MRLIFIHGSGGSKESWQYQTEYFAFSEALDLPGHPIGDPCSTIEGYAQWLQGYIDDRGYKDVVLVGHSLGGGIVLSYELNYPKNLKALILVGSGARLRVHPKFLETLEKAIADVCLLEDFIGQLHDRIDPELNEILKRRAMENGPAVMLNDLQACDKFDVMDRLKEIQAPTLAICGSDDMMTPPKYSNYIADSVKLARAITIPGGTHFVFAENPSEVNEAIEDFLSGL
jgi:pimeloyl-ACP methyl ester carboxylesterase